MIIVTIGIDSFKMKGSKDAEAILNTLNRAVLVRRSYDLPGAIYYREEDVIPMIEVSVVPGEVINHAEYLRLVEAKKDSSKLEISEKKA